MGKVKKQAKNLVIGLICLITFVPACFYACYKTYNESQKKKQDEKRENEREPTICEMIAKRSNSSFTLGVESFAMKKEKENNKNYNLYERPNGGHFRRIAEERAKTRRDEEKRMLKQKEEENREHLKKQEERTLQQKSILVKKLEILERNGAQIDNLYGMESTLEELKGEYETIIEKKMFEERIREDEKKMFEEAYGEVQEEKIREGVVREFKKRRFNRGQCENRI